MTHVKKGDSKWVYDGDQHTNGHDKTPDERLVQAGAELVRLRQENERLTKLVERMANRERRANRRHGRK